MDTIALLREDHVKVLAMLDELERTPYGRLHGITWVARVLGVWTVITPWVVTGGVATTATIVSNVVAGLIAVLLGLGAMSLG
jgi:hypothetical protein